VTITTLRKLLRADKGWHHRPTNRIANCILLLDKPPEPFNSVEEAALKEMTDSWVKRFVLTIWRPMHERAGRHYVYDSRYLLQYVDLLVKIQDHQTLDVFTKNIRKQSGQYFNFN